MGQHADSLTKNQIFLGDLNQADKDTIVQQVKDMGIPTSLAAFQTLTKYMTIKAVDPSVDAALFQLGTWVLTGVDTLDSFVQWCFVELQI